MGFTLTIDGLTHMKVRNPLFFVKQLKNRQFLMKIHKVGLIWSVTLTLTDEITENTNFQTFIVVPLTKYCS